jgi:hypothetical protein
MVNPAALARFTAALLPELISLGRALYEAFDGDVKLARVVIRRIRDHSLEVYAERRKTEAELERLREREQKP